MLVKITRGTTPVLIFKLPFDSSVCKDISVYINQNEKNMLIKQYSDLSIDGNLIGITLKDYETSLLGVGQAELQVFVTTTTDIKMASKVQKIYVFKSLEDEEDEEYV